MCPPQHRKILVRANCGNGRSRVSNGLMHGRFLVGQWLGAPAPVKDTLLPEVCAFAHASRSGSWHHWPVTSLPTLTELATRARFVGSSEHKRLPNPLASPALRSDASDCDEVDPTLSSADPMYLRHILQVAISRGQVSGPVEGDFPRYVHGWILLQGRSVRCFAGDLQIVSKASTRGTSRPWTMSRCVQDPVFGRAVIGGLLYHDVCNRF